MHCQVLAAGNGFAGYDLNQDLRTQGTAPGCLGGEVYTFPSQKAETDWLHQAQASSQQTVTTIYPWIVVGHLWAVQPGDESAVSQVAAELHGRQVTF